MLSPTETATVVLPTGTGTTETLMSALVAGRCNRVLVTVPTNALRGQLVNKFKTLGILKKAKFEIVDKEALYPIVAVSYTHLFAFVSVCQDDTVFLSISQQG